jgi:hypothetical protein
VVPATQQPSFRTNTGVNLKKTLSPPQPSRIPDSYPGIRFLFWKLLLLPN